MPLDKAVPGDTNVFSAIPGPCRYATTVVRGIWYAFRWDGSSLTAGSPEGLQAAIAVDRRHWRRPRVPHTAPAAS